MFPDFLCIGAEKAATSWLYANLYKHPQVWMPPLPAKEVHYFDNLSQGIYDKLFGQRWYDSFWRRLVKMQTKKFLRTFDFKRFLWDYKYLFYPRSDRWYASLFPSEAGIITGDITPTYAFLEDNVVAHIYKIMPQTKIIFLIRNPIHRVWSHTVMEFSQQWPGLSPQWRGKQIDSIPDSEFINCFNNHGGVTLNYLKTLRIWETYFPKEQFFIGFFEDITKHPEDFLIKVYEFLGIDKSREYIPDSVKKKQNPGSGYELPKQLAIYLARKYYDQIEQLHTRFNNEYTQEWLDFAKENLE